MKRNSKMLALLLALLFVLSTGTGLVSAAGDITVTAGGAPLGSVLPNAQKSIDITFPEAVDANSLSNVTLNTVEKTNAIHFSRANTVATASESAGEWRPKNGNETIVFGKGKVTLEFNFNFTSTNRFPRLYFYGKKASTEKQAQRITISNTGTAGASGHGSKSIDIAASAWHTAKIDIDTVSNKFDITIDGANKHTYYYADTTDAGNTLSRINFGTTAGDANTNSDIYYSDIKISYVAENTTTPVNYDIDIVAGDDGDNDGVATLPYGFDWNADVTGGTTVVTVDEVISESEPVSTVTGSLNGNVYTLTNSADWDTGKNYQLTIGAGVPGVTEDLTYNFTVAEPVALSVTDGAGELLGNTLDLGQKELNINFPAAVDETSADANISLDTYTTEKVLRVTDNDTSSYSDSGNAFYWVPETTSTTGQLTLEFDYKYTGNRFLRIYFRGNDPTNNKPEETIGDANFKDSAILLNAVGQGAGTAVTADAWHHVKIVFNQTQKKWDLYVDDIKIGGTQNYKKDTLDGSVTKLEFVAGNGSTAGDVLDICFKNIEITHQPTTGSATTYNTSIADLTVGTQPTFLTYGNGFTGGALACKVDELVNRTAVSNVDRELSADGKVYTLTNNGNWDINANYMLTIGTGVLLDGGTEPAVSEEKTYRFVVRNLNNTVFTLDEIKATGGATLQDNGFISAAAKGIDLTFSNAVNTTSLSGITLQKKNIERVLQTTMPNNATSRNWLNCDLTQFGKSLTDGVYTFSVDTFVNITGYEETTNQIYHHFQCAGDWDGKTGQTLFLVKMFSNKVTASSPSGTSLSNSTISGATLPKAQWRTITYTVDLTNDKYTVTSYDPATGETVKFADNREMRASGTLKNLQFGTSNNNGSTATSGNREIAYKNLKMTYSDGTTTTTLFDIDTDTATFSDIDNYFDVEYKAGDPAPTNVMNSEYVSSTENVNFTPNYDTTTNTVTLTLANAFEYLDSYVLTVPATVTSAGGTELSAGANLNFKAVYNGSLYSAASGFKDKAGLNMITISDTYFGDITGWADITNISTTSTGSAVVIVALYRDGELVDIDTKPVTGIGMGATKSGESATVTIAEAEKGTGYKASVFVWSSMDNLQPVTVKKTTK